MKGLVIALMMSMVLLLSSCGEISKGEYIDLVDVQVQVGDNSYEYLHIRAYEGFIELDIDTYKTDLSEKIYPGKTLKDAASHDQISRELGKFGYDEEQVNIAIIAYWEREK